MDMKTIQTITYVKGEYAGLIIASVVEIRGNGYWAKPLNSEYEKVAYKKAIGYVPIGNREDWNCWGFISENNAS
jgi:hypothetical protein